MAATDPEHIMNHHESNTPVETVASGTDQSTLSGSIFDDLLRGNRLFCDRDKLRPTYTPASLPHRTEEVAALARLLAGTLKGESTPNVFLYGKTGTGKTACVRSVTRELERAGTRRDVQVDVVHLNCEVTDTQYQVLAHLTNALVESNREVGGADAGPSPVPMTGLPTEVVYGTLVEAADCVERSLLVVLDEVDRLATKGGSSALYNLTQLAAVLERSRATVVGISNDLTFTDTLDPRIRSRLGSDELVFPPYDATQLRDIIAERAAVAFEDGVLEDGVCALVAALAAQEHGDARRALDLLRVAGELAERADEGRVMEAHVRQAQARVEFDHTADLVESLPQQARLALAAVASFDAFAPVEAVHERGLELATNLDCTCPGRAQFSSALGDLDALGLVTLVSRTRPRSRQVRLSMRRRDLARILADTDLAGVVG
ncbi:Cdc6/Cdc18 family protein [Haladaptatus sp. GCM10025707]|uniref:Cdc6/Cdc18 family protein n=1 Tax=unclassified Haladaptatus TaxID=2622732 RepID=UPI0023E7DBAF|nr:MULTISPECIES: AAA family ATPase [unclassified Haladaptatus]